MSDLLPVKHYHQRKLISDCEARTIEAWPGEADCVVSHFARGVWTEKHYFLSGSEVKVTETQDVAVKGTPHP